MHVDLLWLTAALLSFPVHTLCDPLNVLVAPNLLRVGTPEKVFVEAQDYNGGSIPVMISVKNYPKKTSELTSKSVLLTADKNYQAIVDITIPDNMGFFSEDPLEKQYVYLQAEFPSNVLEKVVLVSFQSGYMFIQTDKSIYTPGTTVLYRIFSLTPDLQPADKSEEIYVEFINPQGITVVRETLDLKEGTKRFSYYIPEIAKSGIWTVATRYKNSTQKFTAEFEVKEYVLPSFEVTLNPSKTFFYVDDKKLNVDITAKNLFGKDVNGVAFVVFGIKNDETRTSLPASLTRVQIINGNGRAELTKETVLRSFPDINQLVGSFLYISVSVITESGSEIVEAQKGGIQIVTSPYTIQFKRTPKFFHPGMSFDVTVYVTNPDQSPAKNVDILIQPGEVKAQTKTNGMAKAILNTQGGDKPLHITARTSAQGIPNERQAENKMTAQPYATKDGSGNYLHLSVDDAELKIGDQFNIDVNFKTTVPNQDVTYLILSKGQIVQGHKFQRNGHLAATLSLSVTKDLLPSFRLVAYYHVGSSEVVSDSIWVDVTDTCMGTLTLDIKRSKKNTFMPGDEFQLIVTGDPKAKVGLVAVDKAVFVLNKNKLTQAKIWDIIEKHDTGCTAGSGKNSMEVFYDAGLLFESDKLGGTNERTAPECPTPLKRKRRAETLLQVTQTLISKYNNEQKKYCADGLRQNRLGYTCERRASFILDGAECVKAFQDCCKEIQKHKDSQEDLLLLAHGENDDDDNDDDEFISSDDIFTRTNFPESWMWESIELPDCEENIPCDKTSLTLDSQYILDSITTWQVLAISMSKTHGICVADPYEITVEKDFFVDLKLPYSAVRNEQLEIKAVLHNLSTEKMKVRVDFFETEHICSAANKKKKYRTIVNVEAESTISITYVIIPMELGEHHIEVQASSSSRSDGVQRTLKVVSEGVLTELPEQNLELNPSKAGGIQVVHVKTDIPPGMIPNSKAQTYITVAGEELSQTIEQVISGEFMGRLIVQPHGSGEQNMIFMTLPLIATHYLDTTSQWERVVLHRRNEAIKHIQTGYAQELTFRKPDGSYGTWTHTPSSTWLTAYVAKVFALASDLITINEDILCSALKWLNMNSQMPDGSFKENVPVYHGDMVGDVRGKDADASLTAFVLIALQEGQHLCAKLVGILQESSSKATEYLEKRLPSLTNPYAVAMSSYALANAGKFNKQRLMQFSSGDGAYWEVERGHHFSLEATAYSALALVKAKEFDAAGKAVHWLNKQSGPYGDHGSTQATILVFQAVAEFYKQVKDLQNTDLTVYVSVSGRRRQRKWNFNKNTAYLTRSEKVQLRQEVNVTATGTGAGVLKVTTVYYDRPVQKKSDCKKFDLSVEMRQESNVSYLNAKESYEVIINIQFKDPERDATMSILDIGLLTGFMVDENDLRDLTVGSDKYIQKFEMDKQLSERGSLIMYLDKVSHSLPDRIVFRVHKINNVALLQPAAVSVYEYYSPGERCMKFYHPTKKDGALNILCSDQKDLCQCAEENCSVQKKQKIGEEERENKACEAGIDYVYKVKFISVDQRPNTDYYEMKIEDVLKGDSDPDVLDKIRTFMGQANCRQSFGFVEGKSYLIMGHSADLQRIEGKLQYILGEWTWIEYWPTSEEGQTSQYKETYISIGKLAQMLEVFGCTT
ncbi:complement C3-like isoform X1 [Tachysurus fulvidraco]|uniref:complement C3-like isoform X1 n=1 Tax=Tachysurus fulvidraco TaxID=1234273 RepID=UPI001FEF7683|nr:complement C3-like isoform X1 [Tachysurus fulvidraco]